eukprot:1460458-Alexandrium_andersonii.AAC.1
MDFFFNDPQIPEGSTSFDTSAPRRHRPRSPWPAARPRLRAGAWPRCAASRWPPPARRIWPARARDWAFGRSLCARLSAACACRAKRWAS